MPVLVVTLIKYSLLQVAFAGGVALAVRTISEHSIYSPSAVSNATYG